MVWASLAGDSTGSVMHNLFWPPGTIATFNNNGPTGITTAWLLWRVPWFPNRKVILQAHLESFWRTATSRLWISSATWSLPITVLLAPKSKMPWDPYVAKQMVASRTSDAGTWPTCFDSVSGLLAWTHVWCFGCMSRCYLNVSASSILAGARSSLLRPQALRRSRGVGLSTVTQLSP